MRKYSVVCLLFGIALGCIFSVGNKVDKIDSIYSVSTNIIIVLITLASIFILSMLKVDCNIKLSQVIFGYVLEIIVALMVSFMLNKF